MTIMSKAAKIKKIDRLVREYRAGKKPTMDQFVTLVGLQNGSVVDPKSELGQHLGRCYTTACERLDNLSKESSTPLEVMLDMNEVLDDVKSSLTSDLMSFEPTSGLATNADKAMIKSFVDNPGVEQLA